MNPKQANQAIKDALDRLSVGQPLDSADAVDVKVHPEDPNLVLLDYRRDAQFKKPHEWTPLEQVSRGLILNLATREIVARPFDKFWNWGEVSPTPGASIISVTEKLDGSMGILYRHDGQLKIATRGSFESPQALWATDWLNKNIPRIDIWVPWSLTPVFEIIYPENRIVVDYENYRGLRLIGCRDRLTGYDLRWSEMHDVLPRAMFGACPLPAFYHLDSAEEILKNREMLGPNREGYVVRFSDGLRLKVKGDEYLRLHRFVSSFSFKRVVECLREDALAELKPLCPPHYRGRLDRYVEHIEGEVNRLDAEIAEAHRDVMNTVGLASPRDERDFKAGYASVVQAYYPKIAKHLYRVRDGKYNRRDLYDVVTEPSEL